MTQHELIVDAFKRRGWKATLGELLEEGRYTFAYKFTARVSELRTMGYIITCDRAKIPSDNVYTMTPPKTNYVPEYSFSDGGQGEFFI